MRLTPVDIKVVEQNTANIYEAVIVASKRARIINDDNKLEFNTLLNTILAGREDEFEEKENPDQLRISVEFEKKPKPHLMALQELMNNEISYRYKED
ncbi:MAG: DNA-directed RNA polymerase subunit omega [Bacteroidetes bacterium]|nr:DNA-directed RNA polymerase subunit omega [Bacteroidota bacterium]